MMAPLSLLGSLALLSGIVAPASATFNLFLSTQVTFTSWHHFTFRSDISESVLLREIQLLHVLRNSWIMLTWKFRR